jgi:N6-L-threonylcarbamoyladenine synthase
MRILGIETSCDETAASVIDGKRDKIFVLSNIVSSQIEIHKKYGGVVPEVAAREHVLNILPVVNEALVEANLTPQPPLLIRRGDGAERRGRGIDAIAVTIGPGLITSLIAGIETAKALSYAWNIPVIGVNHIEGHIYANFITPHSPLVKGAKENTPLIRGAGGVQFPALILTVSGGHTMLVLMKGHGKYKTIGETVDDAAGEAFDKAAAMLGIGYPGGPVVSAYADKFKITPQPPLSGGRLPRPMINSKDYNFSFSGLKTALLYQIQKDPKYNPEASGQISNYCAEFQQAVIDVLIYKTIKAAKNFKVKTIMLSGGVAANIELRKQMAEAVKIQVPHSKFHIPSLQYTTDNAAMIAAAGYYKAIRKEFTPWQKLKVNCNAEL